MNVLASKFLSIVITAQAAVPTELPAQPGFSEIMAKMFPMFVVVFLIFYFMVVKPQNQKLRSQQSLLSNLKKGDQVVTTGGIIARVASLEEDCVVLDLSNNVRLKVEREHIIKKKESKVQERSAA